MVINDWLTLGAIVLGPIMAVLVSIYLDIRRQNLERKWMIFRLLMQDRGNPTSYNFVTAFNLIQVEFIKEVHIIKIWKELFKILTSVPDVHNITPMEFTKLVKDTKDLTTKLLFEIGKKLGCEVEQLDIQDSYSPRVWGHVEEENKQIRNLLIKLLKKEGSIKLDVVDFTNADISDEVAEQS